MIWLVKKGVFVQTQTKVPRSVGLHKEHPPGKSDISGGTPCSLIWTSEKMLVVGLGEPA